MVFESDFAAYFIIKLFQCQAQEKMWLFGYILHGKTHTASLVYVVSLIRSKHVSREMSYCKVYTAVWQTFLKGFYVGKSVGRFFLFVILDFFLLCCVVMH